VLWLSTAKKEPNLKQAYDFVLRSLGDA